MEGPTGFGGAIDEAPTKVEGVAALYTCCANPSGSLEYYAEGACEKDVMQFPFQELTCTKHHGSCLGSPSSESGSRGRALEHRGRARSQGDLST